MSDTLKALIELVQKNKTCNEICDILKITNKQLYNYINILEDQGYLLKRKYYADGEIVYSIIDTIDGINNLYNRFATDSTTIITEPGNNILKCLVISDLHYGNSKSRLDLIEKVYDYCAQENIHTVFCCGDIIDGTFSAREQSIPDTHEQIKYLIKKHPHRQNILTYAIGGDHDLSVLKKRYQDLRAIVRNYRHDIIMPSYQTEIIKIKNDSILLYHPILTSNAKINNKISISKNGVKTEIDVRDFVLRLEGHHHKCYSTVHPNGNVEIGIPSISEIQLDGYQLPAAIQLDLSFYKGYIKEINVYQLLFFNDKIIPINNMQYNLQFPQNTESIIKNEENRTANAPKTKKRKK